MPVLARFVTAHNTIPLRPCQASLCLEGTDAFVAFQDEASFVAGERAALLRAFRETLPSQQALGSLFHAVQHLTKRMDQEGNDVHQARHMSAESCVQQVFMQKMIGRAHLTA